MNSLLDRAWLSAHPLPVPDSDADKNSRGRVLLVAGAEYVPGAARLTGEAVLRVGAGKLQIATVASIATALGVLMPEAAMIALEHGKGGEIAAKAAERLMPHIAACDTLILGPGMSADDETEALTKAVLSAPRDGLSIVLDAAALTHVRRLRDQVAAHEGRIVMTPHHGEMASLCEANMEAVSADPEGYAQRIAADYRAFVVLKSAQTLIVTPEGDMLDYRSECPGLATGGSGDVLAGAIGGLMARGAHPLSAAGWGVWLHGEAGRELAEGENALGFLARELPACFPRLLAMAENQNL